MLKKILSIIRKPFKLYRIKKKIGVFFLKKRKYKCDKSQLISFGKISLGYKMDLDNPKTFNEKINWYKLNYKNDLMPICADKYAVREYIKKKGLEDILVKNYGVYDSVEEIDFSKLPNEFVVKVTGDSGGVVICKEKSKFRSLIGDKFAYLKKDYSNDNKEWVYHHIVNRLTVEELIKTKDGKSPKDYKFFCFNGEPKFLFVASDRDKEVKFDFFDINWNKLNVRQGHANSKTRILKPKKLDQMLEICRILSKDFPHVRVDLYYENDTIYFGELTFFHFSGMTPFRPRKFDHKFGEFFDISTIFDS